MFAKAFASRTVALAGARQFHSSRPNNFKVGVIGAAGGIGQPLSLLLTLEPKVTELSLYDLSPVTPGVGADLGHINRKTKISAFKGEENLVNCLKGCDIVVIPAGVPRKPGMTRDDLFNTNAAVAAKVARAASEACPNASLLIITNPVNSTVPIVAEVLKKRGTYDKRKLFGVTTLDVVRANKFVSEKLGFDAKSVNVPVIGGHAGITILPLLSQVPKNDALTQEVKEQLTNRIMFGGDEVVKAKDGAGSATLSMAWAAAHFTNSIMRGLEGEAVVECTYVENDTVPGASFFSSPVLLGRNGVEKILPLPSMSDYEKKLFDAAIPELQSSIQKGVEFVAKNPQLYQ